MGVVSGGRGSYLIKMAATVKHNEDACKFFLPLEGGESANLFYRVDNTSGVWDCYHTEVPSSHQGKGLGGVLAKVSKMMLTEIEVMLSRIAVVCCA